ncbi:CAP domain-containing protein [Acidicapsa dinghuensis]|uniref:CAP domain-containing protein n=1 Tax=Acidicapsa dinghuensis TaxID=2218256 RepID=A0ABW1EJH8_9BACT|nr:CAP domain-containing protein [Acidicapsa dinghuensis]
MPLFTQSATSDQTKPPQALISEARWLFAQANASRAAAGVGTLAWDDALANAALQHCLRMAVEGPIEHRYTGEPGLTERAGSAGAHFSLIEENIAVGSYTSTIHQGWLDSQEHRLNLLSPRIDHVGIAVVASQGVLFADADYARSVAVLTPPQIEASFATLIRTFGASVSHDPSDARAACSLDDGLPVSIERRPRYILRWQGPELNHLPQELSTLLSSKRYSSATVGNCAIDRSRERFTVYRMAVLLY